MRINLNNFKPDLVLINTTQVSLFVSEKYYAINIQPNGVTIKWGEILPITKNPFCDRGTHTFKWNMEKIKKVVKRKLRQGYIFSNKKEFLTRKGRKILSAVISLQECGCCGCYHPDYFNGDCRDDNNRYPTDNPFDKKDNIRILTPPKNKWQKSGVHVDRT